MKRLSVEEFRELGFLQEANRQFFHPLGLALAVEVDDDGNEKISSVLDARDDPLGFTFVGLNAERYAKCKNVEQEKHRHKDARIKLFGSEIQPIEKITDASEI